MPEPVYVDSGAWIALLSHRDQWHREAERLLRHGIKQRVDLWTSNLVLAEVQRRVLHRVGIEAAYRALERISRIEHVSVEFATLEHHDKAMEWLRRFADQDFTYTDATSFAVMERLGLRTAFAFDPHFRQYGFQVLGLSPR